ncbi:MAG: iron ABC transporter permease [Pseudomonadota bacterium]
MRLWTLPALAIAALTLAPLGVVAASFLTPSGEWGHLSRYVLPEVTANTVWLVVVVGLASLVLGAVAGWLTSVCEFPGRRFFSWALLLPLAMPGYVIAFALSGFFAYSAPLPSTLRDLGLALPDPSAGVAAACCLSLTLYPYVYLLARQAFRTQGIASLEVAQSLGMSRLQGFRRVALPLARPWLAAGVALVCMDTMADFGTVKVFNFDTYTTAIYGAWFELFSLSAALQMSVLLMLLVVVALSLERWARGSARYATKGRMQGSKRIALRGWHSAAATAFCAVVFTFAFALPAGQLLVWGVSSLDGEWGARYFEYFRASLVLASLAAGMVTVLGLALGYSERRAPGRVTAASARIATLGYALPGTVLAVAFFVVVAGLGHALTSVARWFTPGVTITLTGTLAVMLLAYAARFMAVAYGPLGSAFERITPRIDDAARGLGATGVRLLTRVHIPILRGGIATAALLVFVDVMKELPITLITRPFNWDTLAVRVFNMTVEGEWERAAIPAIAIVCAGLVPVLWLHRRTGDDAGGA